jgi:hypothetical protein
VSRIKVVLPVEVVATIYRDILLYGCIQPETSRRLEKAFEQHILEWIELPHRNEVQ